MFENVKFEFDPNILLAVHGLTLARDGTVLRLAVVKEEEGRLILTLTVVNPPTTDDSLPRRPGRPTRERLTAPPFSPPGWDKI